jgi:hypothetical protein
MQTHAPTLYLSPAGNDAHSGLAPDLESGLDGPLKTLSQALRRVRQLRVEGALYGLARIVLQAGSYPVHRPLKVYPYDSDVHIEAEVPGAVELCGSIRWGDFTETVLPHGVKALQADVSSIVSYHGPFHTLFLGDKRLTRARWPKAGFFEVERFAHRYAEVDIFQGQNEFIVKEADWIEGWVPGPDLQVNIQHCWVHERQDVETVDVPGRRVTMNSKTAINPHYTTIPTAYSLENDLRFVTEPGDWYLDRQTGMLTVIPPEEPTGEDFVVDIPVTNQWLRLVGDEASGATVRNVSFEGIRFKHADWKMGTPGETRWEPQADMPPRPKRTVLPHAEDPTEHPRPIGGAVQAAIYVPGTIQGCSAENCRFLNCDFEGPSFYGILLEDGCRNNLIQNCRFSNMGAGAVYLDGSPDPDEPHKHNRGNTIADCDIRGGGHVFFQACGLLVTHAAWTRLLHNRVHDMTYTGISVGWKWNYDPAVNRDNLIIGNHVSDIGIRGDLWDMGGIYLLGYQPGSVVRGNVVEEVHCRGFSGWGLYLDEGTAGFLVERNLVWKTHSHSLHEHWGRQNMIRHNCFAHGGEGGMALNNEPSHSWVRHPAPESRIEHNVILSPKAIFEDFGGLLAAGRIEQGHFYHDHNVMWSTASADGDKVWVWREDVYDENSREEVYDLAAVRAMGMEAHGEVRKLDIDWDRATRDFRASEALAQIGGNAELWKTVGPRV